MVTRASIGNAPDLVDYCRTHEFVENIYCFCEGLFSVRRAVKMVVPTGGPNLGQPSLRCSGGCSYFVNLQELFGHGNILIHMAIYPEHPQVRKHQGLRDISGSQITPRRTTGLAAFSTPGSDSGTPRPALAASSMIHGTLTSTSSRRTSFLAPAAVISLESDSETEVTPSFSQKPACSSPFPATSSTPALKRKHPDSRPSSHVKRRRTITAPPDAPMGVRPLPPPRRRKSAVERYDAIVISDSECPVVIPPELATMVAEVSSRKDMGKAREEVSYISDSDQERPPAQ
ncbi:hypothetical protein OH76DRAFT_1421155 [Lentinus brumalis]|uniref:Uncharacterized protein n=1 Tax=Lentinus brumalis TaxID=2498619 RepID=A0A371CWX1_9APHY|nr:hypothetical protein OH76DRAFT_1421155 [Polyporus brumalis]